MPDMIPAAAFLLQSLLITIPGLLTPGPVTAVTLERGTATPHAGAFVTLGHLVVEFPLVLLLFSGLGRFTKEPAVRFPLAFAGGLFLFYLSWKTFRAMNIQTAGTKGGFSSSFSAGLFMTLANPFLLLWWGTIGSTLILRSIELGTLVSILFYLLHISVNFVWLYLLSFLSYKGYIVFGRRYRITVAIICGCILAFFGGYFIVTALKYLNN